MGLFKFSISSHLSFGTVWVLRNLSVSSRLSSLLAYNFSQYSLKISQGLIVIISFSFVILSIWVLSLLFEKAGQRFINFVYFFKKPTLGFVDLLYTFFRFYTVYFCSDLYYFSSSSGFRLPLLFCFYFLQVCCQILYLGFFLFLEIGLNCNIFSSQDCFCCIPKRLDCCIFILICLHIFFDFFSNCLVDPLILQQGVL